MIVSTASGVDCVAATKFVEALCETSGDVWLNATNDRRGSSSGRPTALAVLASHARQLRLGLVVWSIADDIETAAWYALPRNWRAPRTQQEARMRAQAIDAARTAACAILLRRHLTLAQFEVLCGCWTKNDGDRLRLNRP